MIRADSSEELDDALKCVRRTARDFHQYKMLHVAEKLNAISDTGTHPIIMISHSKKLLSSTRPARTHAKAHVGSTGHVEEARNTCCQQLFAPSTQGNGSARTC